jgi:hypothetical protein
MSVNVQSDLSDLTGNTLNITIDEVNLSNAWVRLTTRFGGTAVNHDVTGRLTSTTNLRLQRGGTSGTPVVSWFVIEDSEATVQRGESAMGSTVDDLSVTIDSVDLDKSFIAVTVRSSGGNMNIGYVTAVFTNATTIRLRRQETGSAVTVSWEVVTISDATVQSGYTEIPEETSIVNDTITSVDLDHAFVIAHRSASDPRLDRSHAMTWLTSATQIRSQREGAFNPMAVGWFVVECPRYDVQLATSLRSSSEILSTSIDTVDLDKSWLTTSWRVVGSGTSTSNARLNVYFAETAPVPAYDGSSDPEEGLDPSQTYNNGDDVVSAEYNSSDSALWSVDCVFTEAPIGTLVSAGGTGTGFWVGITDGALVARWGNGQSGFPDDTARVVVTISDYDFTSFSGTIHIECNTLLGEVAVAFDSGSTGTVNYWKKATAVTIPANWSGGAAGGIGFSPGGPGSTDEDHGDWNGTITEARLHNTLYVPSFVDGIPSFFSVVRHKQTGSNTAQTQTYVIEMTNVTTQIPTDLMISNITETSITWTWTDVLETGE